MKISPRYRKPVFFAVFLHVILLCVLIFNFGPTLFHAPQSSAPMQTIQAHAIIEPNAAAQIEHQEKILQEKKIEEQKKEKMAQEKIEKAKQAEAKKELMEARALANAKLLAQKQKAEKAEKLKQAKIKQAKLEKQKQQKIVAEKSEKLKAAKKLSAEQKKLQQQLMQQQINSEAKSISAAVSQAQQGAIDKYKAAILSAIQSNWRIDQLNSKLKCIYSVNIAPDGTVLSIQLTKSSGDSALDQSAQQAITLASPLPVPHNPALFNHFRQLVLTLSPQGYLQSVGSA